MKNLLLLLVVACVCVAQDAATKCRLEGTVFSAATSEPLKKVEMVLSHLDDPGKAGYDAATDASGQYVIEGVEPGRYQLSAARSGFVTQSYGAKATNPMLGTLPILEPGQKIDDLNFKLIAQGVVQGRVIDEDGEPVADASVQCFRSGYSSGKQELQPTRSLHPANDLGEFRIYGLAAGKYYVNAAGAAAQGYPPTFYPSARSLATAVPIEIAPGTVLHDMDITLIKKHAARVSGTLAGSDAWKPAGQVELTLRHEEESGFAMDRMYFAHAGNGSFAFRGVVPGVYILRAISHADGARLSARAQIEVKEADLEGLELTLAPGLRIRGTLRVEDNVAIPSGRLSVRMRQNEFGAMVLGSSDGLVQDEGAFVLADVLPEPYTLSVLGMPPGFYLKSVRSADANFTEGIDFSQGVTASELTVVISPHGGQVEGTVQNNKHEPGVNVKVVLIPEANHRSRRDLIRNAATDQSGHYTIHGIAPAEYKLFAWEDVERDAYMDPEFLKPFENAGEAVTIREDSHESKALTLIREESAKEKRR